MTGRVSRRARLDVFVVVARARRLRGAERDPGGGADARSAAFCATQYRLVSSFTTLAPTIGAGARGDTRSNAPHTRSPAEVHGGSGGADAGPVPRLPR